MGHGIQDFVRNTPEQLVSIRRLGGAGKRLWTFESQLDEGNNVDLPFAEVQKLAESAEDFLEDFWGVMGKTQFGISDSSFLFVQCDDKTVELNIASRFESFRDFPDASPPPAPDSPN